MDFKKICYRCMKEKSSANSVCEHCGFDNSKYQCPENHLQPLTPLNGKYLIGAALGAGGFGITYIAYDTHLQVVVAIKELFLRRISQRGQSKTIYVLPKDRDCFEENKKRFLYEARILAMFNEKDNEGVVIVKDHFEENNTAYIVMEYLAGTTLKRQVGRKKMALKEVDELMAPIFHALIKIHQFRVVHLDVSPDNIMILGSGRAKLLDFGGAKTIGVKQDNDIVAFKRGYAPPEQYMENGKLGQWTDVYATAATIYFCLTGKKPLDSMDRKAGAELELPSKMGIKIPKGVEKALMKALEIEPARRYQTMEEFWNDFHSSKGGSGKAVVIGAVLVTALGVGGYFGYSNFIKPKIIDNHPETNQMETIPETTPQTVQETIPEATPETVQETVVETTPETVQETVAETTPETVVEVTQEPEIAKTVGDTIPIELGTYIFENAENRDFILGIDGGFGDDGTLLVLKNYEDSNKNRLFITDEIEEDGFYNLRAAHTNSFIETQGSQEIGEHVRQFSEMYDSGTEKWVFVYCGYDEAKQMDEVIILNAAGSVLAPQDGQVSSNTPIVLEELDMNDETQKWFMRWSEKDPSEEDVIVYHEGDLVNNIAGVYNIASALDGMTSMTISRDEAFHPEPTVVVFQSEWLTNEDVPFMFEFIPTGEESRYKIMPCDQTSEKRQFLEYNPETNEIVMRDESDSTNQLFRIVYVRSNTYLIQAYNESVIGFDLDSDGSAVGKSVLARPYDAIEDSRLESWLLTLPHAD